MGVALSEEIIIPLWASADSCGYLVLGLSSDRLAYVLLDNTGHADMLLTYYPSDVETRYLHAVLPDGSIISASLTFNS